MPPTAPTLNLKVKEVTDTACVIELSGSASLADDNDKDEQRLGQFRFYGELSYNRKTKAFERIELAAVGAFVHGKLPEYAAQLGQEKSVNLGLVFELALPDSVGYGTIPWALYLWVGTGRTQSVNEYFGSNPYEK